jgi:L-threonylcarbamoyladenylate synthase
VTTQTARAVAVLRAGGLVAFPTETVYGLGADAANPDALGLLFRVKGRPTDHPVIVHVARAEELDLLGRDVPAVAHAFAHAFWPGPLTIVVRRNPELVAPEATGGRDTVGIRVPNHPVALQLLAEFGGGVAAPSANRFGRVSPTTAQHVRDDLGADVDIVLDGGPSAVGVESTIIDVSGPEPLVLRVGGIGEDALARIAGAPIARRTGGEIAAPGTLASHYAPDARVELVAGPDLEARAARLRGEGLAVGILDAPADPAA